MTPMPSGGVNPKSGRRKERRSVGDSYQEVKRDMTQDSDQDDIKDLVERRKSQYRNRHGRDGSAFSARAAQPQPDESDEDTAEATGRDEDVGVDMDLQRRNREASDTFYADLANEAESVDEVRERLGQSPDEMDPAPETQTDVRGSDPTAIKSPDLRMAAEESNRRLREQGQKAQDSQHSPESTRDQYERELRSRQESKSETERQSPEDRLASVRARRKQQQSNYDGGRTDTVDGSKPMAQNPPNGGQGGQQNNQNNQNNQNQVMEGQAASNPDLSDEQRAAAQQQSDQRRRSQPPTQQGEDPSQFASEVAERAQQSGIENVDPNLIDDATDQAQSGPGAGYERHSPPQNQNQNPREEPVDSANQRQEDQVQRRQQRARQFRGGNRSQQSGIPQPQTGLPQGMGGGGGMEQARQQAPPQRQQGQPAQGGGQPQRQGQPAQGQYPSPDEVGTRRQGQAPPQRQQGQPAQGGGQPQQQGQPAQGQGQGQGRNQSQMSRQERLRQNRDRIGVQDGRANQQQSGLGQTVPGGQPAQGGGQSQGQVDVRQVDPNQVPEDLDYENQSTGQPRERETQALKIGRGLGRDGDGYWFELIEPTDDDTYTLLNMIYEEDMNIQERTDLVFDMCIRKPEDWMSLADDLRGFERIALMNACLELAGMDEMIDFLGSGSNTPGQQPGAQRQR